MSKTAIVPVDQTREMQWAMIWQHEETSGDRLPDGEGFDFEIVNAMHKAMVDARPAVPDELIEEAAKEMAKDCGIEFGELKPETQRYFRNMARAAARVFNGGKDE